MGANRTASRRRHPGALALTIVAVLAMAVACSGDDTSSVTTASATSVVPDTTAASTTAATTAAPSATTSTAVVTTAVPTTTAPAGALSPWPCPAEAPDRAECHRLSVPADWAEPGGATTVSLPIVVIPARNPGDGQSPIVIPAGGPGFEGLGGADYWSTTDFNELHPIVLYDQRGTGQAEPSLECPERDAAWLANLQRNEPFEAERAAIVDALVACRDRLEAGGVDLADYDTEASVADLDAIREALGYQQWDILGISYGARLALAAMRSTPDSIRSVILDSVYDVSYGGIAATVGSGNQAFGALASACAADPSCNERYPDLLLTLERARTRYNTTPAETDVDLGDGKGPQHFVITGDDIIGGLFQAMYDAATIPLLPALIASAAVGDLSVLPEFIKRAVPFATGQADAMTMSMNCADNAGLGVVDDDEAIIADPGQWAQFAADMTCAEWDVPPTSGSFNEAIESDIPALVLAGAFDPVTPPAATEAVARRLTRATFGLWPNQGHGVTGEPCAVEIELAFLADPAAEVDPSCLAAVAPPTWV